MAIDPATTSHLSNSGIRSIDEVHIRHPLNPASDVFLKRLAPIFGLKRLALYIARVPPGKESFALHRHERNEEFIFILSGHGRAKIGDREIDVGPGDIMAFPAPDGPPHHLSNPFKEDLVYLMGGESAELDIAYFPTTGQQLIFTGSGIRLIDDDKSTSMDFKDWHASQSEDDE
jgi:uncharacterized cupin superfamily protein